MVAFGSALLLAGVLSSPAPAQESAAEKAREKQADTAAAGMLAAALSHLRQAEEELEKANNEHGGHGQQTLKQVQQAEQSVLAGIQWYNAKALNKNKK